MDRWERRLSSTVATPDFEDGEAFPPKDRRSAAELDGGWSWVVLAATFTAFFLSCGLGYNMGIFFVSFLDTFNESKSYTAWIGAVYSAVFQISGPLSSLLLPIFGARLILIFGGLIMSISYALLYTANSVLYIIIVYGVFAGVGCLFVVSGSVSSMVQYFDRRLFLASGVMSAGGGLGIMVVGLLTEFLIDIFGWRGALLLLGAICLQTCVCGALVFDNGRQPKKRTSAGSGSGSVTRHFRDVRFWFLNISLMAMNMGGATVYVFFKDILIEKGLGSSFKTFITCVGAASTVGRGVSGFLTAYLDPNLYYSVTGVVCAFSVLLLTATGSETLVVAVACLFGLCHGVMAVLQTLQIAHVFGYDQMPIIWGYGMGFGSVCVLLAPPLGGLIADRTGNYNGSIVFFASLFFISGLFSFLTYVVQRTRRNRKDEEEDEEEEEEEEDEKQKIKKQKNPGENATNGETLPLK